jgi:DNA-directed RNA polymerase subunit B
MIDSSNKRWIVIQDILTREGIAKQHLNSFDEFLKNGIQEIINEVDKIDIENAEYPYKIQLGKIKLQQPRMMELDGSITHVTPTETRLRNVSYVAPLMMEANVVEDGKILEQRFLHIGDMPIMGGSI